MSRDILIIYSLKLNRYIFILNSGSLKSSVEDENGLMYTHIQISSLVKVIADLKQRESDIHIQTRAFLSTSRLRCFDSFCPCPNSLKLPSHAKPNIHSKPKELKPCSAQSWFPVQRVRLWGGLVIWFPDLDSLISFTDNQS
jgi:hypothetical protein